MDMTNADGCATSPLGRVRTTASAKLRLFDCRADGSSTPESDVDIGLGLAAPVSESRPASAAHLRIANFARTGQCMVDYRLVDPDLGRRPSRRSVARRFSPPAFYKLATDCPSGKSVRSGHFHVKPLVRK